MLAEFLLRLAVALPIICGLAVASLFAVKRGWLRLPGLSGLAAFPPRGKAPGSATDTAFAVVSVKALSPAARIAVVRFSGRELLIGVSGQALMLLAEQPSVSPHTAHPTPAKEHAA